MNSDSDKGSVGFSNPFRPGAGHMPPYLAGRADEEREFLRLLEQEVILENLVLTGLRGVGKTVLLETFKPLAQQNNWLWVGTDLSESTSVSENNLAIRLLTDLSVITSGIEISSKTKKEIGFQKEVKKVSTTLGFGMLTEIYDQTPGLVIDKLKFVLELVFSALPRDRWRGVVFAYDEAQILSDHAEKDEYPLSLLLDTFQSIQRKNIPFMLVLTGLPTLFPKLVDARTYSERMFHVLFLDSLNAADSKDAIVIPAKNAGSPVAITEESVEAICKVSGGYPYFIQFICREVFDVWVQHAETGEYPRIPMNEIVEKLDADFFTGRWSRATDRQRDLLKVIAMLENAESEFTVQEIAALSQDVLEKPFSASHTTQMLGTLGDAGLIYKNRHGRYSFAVPLLARFINRQLSQDR